MVPIAQAPSKGSEQHVHSCTLIRTLAVHTQYSWTLWNVRAKIKALTRLGEFKSLLSVNRLFFMYYMTQPVNEGIVFSPYW